MARQVPGPSCAGGPLGATVRPRAVDRHHAVRRRERRGVFQQLGQQVHQVGDGMADHVHLVGHVLLDALVLLDLGDRGEHHLGQRHRLRPAPAGVPAGEDQQVFVVTSHAGRQVVQLEQDRELVGVGLAGLEPVEQLELPLDQALAASSQVDEHRVDRAAHPGLLGGEAYGAVVHRDERLRHLTDLVLAADRGGGHLAGIGPVARTQPLDRLRQPVLGHVKRLDPQRSQRSGHRPPDRPRGQQRHHQDEQDHAGDRDGALPLDAAARVGEADGVIGKALLDAAHEVQMRGARQPPLLRVDADLRAARPLHRGLLQAARGAYRLAAARSAKERTAWVSRSSSMKAEGCGSSASSPLMQSVYTSKAAHCRSQPSLMPVRARVTPSMPAIARWYAARTAASRSNGLAARRRSSAALSTACRSAASSLATRCGSTVPRSPPTPTVASSPAMWSRSRWSSWTRAVTWRASLTWRPNCSRLIACWTEEYVWNPAMATNATAGIINTAASFVRTRQCCTRKRGRRRRRYPGSAPRVLWWLTVLGDGVEAVADTVVEPLLSVADPGQAPGVNQTSTGGPVNAPIWWHTSYTHQKVTGLDVSHPERKDTGPCWLIPAVGS